MDLTVWTIIGIIAALLTSFSFVPQVRKMWLLKSAKDVSHITMFQLLAGCSLWLIYGISLHDPVIIGANIIGVATLIIALILYYRYHVTEE